MAISRPAITTLIRNGYRKPLQTVAWHWTALKEGLIEQNAPGIAPGSCLSEVWLRRADFALYRLRCVWRLREFGVQQTVEVVT